MGSSPVRIVLCGPQGVGKTRLSHVWGGKLKSTSVKTRPTQGLRIITAPLGDAHDEQTTLQIWDLSGDTAAQNVFLVVRKAVHGVVIVLDPNSASWSDSLLVWHQKLIDNNIRPPCCRVLWLTADGQDVEAEPTLRTSNSHPNLTQPLSSAISRPFADHWSTGT